MAATIKDIAKATGLGYATISAYLNGVAVRPKNKVAIENAIQHLGYVRNEYARGLKTHRSMTIGVLIPELNNVFSTTIISEMEDVLRKNGYGIIVCDCRSDAELEQKSIKFLMSKMVDGMIIMPISTDGKMFGVLEECNLPIVVIDRLTDSDKVSHIIINNREVSRNAVAKLIEKGHKNVAIITGDMNVYTAYERCMGYKESLQSAGLYNEKYVFNGKLSVEGGYKAAKQIITQCSEVDALFVTNYEMTVGAIIAINEEGKRIPEDFSFVGFDNMELSKVFSPRLATVNQPLKEIGTVAAETMLAQIKLPSPTNIILKAEIEQGESIKVIPNNN